MAAFQLGMVSLAASIFFSKTMFHYESLNPMEAVYVTSLIGFVVALIALF